MSEFVGRLGDFGGVVVHLHFVPPLRHLAFGVDEIRGPHDAHVLAPVARLLLPYAVLLCHLVFGVREQREGNPVLAGELRLALLVENADAKYRGLPPLIGGQTRLELARLLGAAWRVVLRVEVEHHVLSGVVRQPVRLAVLILQRERWSLLTCFDE